MAIIKLTVTLILIAVTIALSIRTDQKGGVKTITWRPAGTVLGVILMSAFIALAGSIGAVNAGERGVVLRFGAVTGRTLQPGLYVVVPFVESVQIMSVKVEAYSAKSDAVSKDMQNAKTTITLNYLLDEKKVGKVYQTLGTSYEERIINPAVQESVKAATAKFDASSLVAKREVVKSTIQESLRNRLAMHGIIIDTISITDFSFDATFMNAVEQKVTATQLSMKAQNDLERIKFEAQQKIETAKAEAESLRVQKEQITPELIKLRQIEVQKAAIDMMEKKWNGQLPTYMGGDGPIPFLDVAAAK